MWCSFLIVQHTQTIQLSVSNSCWLDLPCHTPLGHASGMNLGVQLVPSAGRINVHTKRVRCQCAGKSTTSLMIALCKLTRPTVHTSTASSQPTAGWYLNSRLVPLRRQPDCVEVAGQATSPLADTLEQCRL